jgi:hypothetical protein
VTAPCRLCLRLATSNPGPPPCLTSSSAPKSIFWSTPAQSRPRAGRVFPNGNHLQKLGTPAEGRAAARSGDYDTLWRIYDRHIKKAEPQEALDELIGLIKSGKRVALLCYCRDPKTCHRSRIVADVKKRARVKVEDLVPLLF